MHRMMSPQRLISFIWRLSRQSVLWILREISYFACLSASHGNQDVFQKENGFDDVSVNNAIARRATLKEKKSGGTRIHSFPFRTCFSRMYALLMPCIPSGISKTSCSAMQTTTRQSTLHCAQRPIRSQRQGLHMSRCRLHISL